MKTQTLIKTLAFTLIMLMTINLNAQNFPELDKSPMDAAAYPSDYKESKKLIKIVYSRPQLRNRSLDELIPLGKVWRTGANEAAELTVYEDMMFGDAKLAPGTYTLFIIPEKEHWVAIISKDINVWGSYFYNEENDVASTKVPVLEGKKRLEAFSIVFEKADGGINMHLGWGNLRAAFPFKTL